MNIVFLDAFTTNPGDIDFSILSQLGDFVAYDFTTEKEMPERVKSADVVIVNKHLVSIDLLLNAPQLKYVVVAATGFNNIDSKAVQSKEIPVSNVRGYSTQGVSQYVMASILNHYNKLHIYHNEVNRGRWKSSRDFCFFDHSFIDASSLKLGIIGFGAIGQKVADMAKGCTSA
jgi:glycerate dehydrogenase